MKRTEIKDLKPGKKVRVHGWVRSIRDQKSIMFLILGDRESLVQVIIKKEEYPEVAHALEGIQINSTVVLDGRVVAAPNVKLGGIEIIPTKVTVTSRAAVSPIDEKSGLDLQLDYRWLDLRCPVKTGYFKVQTEILRAMREWFVKNKYIEIMTPKITGHSTEGGAEVFEVKYFDKKAYLTQSPQLFKQMGIAAGFEKVFEVGASYRAEKSFTSRHATEFFGVDVEIGFVDSEHDVMDAQEAMLAAAFKQIGKSCADLFKKLDIQFNGNLKKFPRITLLQAYDLLLKERGYEVPKASKGDLDPESERLLCEISAEKWGSDFIFITDFPVSARPFYIMKGENAKFTRGYDLLYRGVEITSGGQREHRADVLRESIRAKGMNPEDLNFYVQFFEYGCPPHGGYCIGLARIVSKILGLPSVKDVIYLFRGPDRLSP
ncbi:MAG: aspartate--tRNA(Asn) ligase [Firmicutes bacterium]|nr:aspartate--tRNA(Asn) ligase [Bacillota bacterium]